jgi:hypothetical protein
MKKIFLTLIILTLTSCMVSKKAFDEKCCALECEIKELNDKATGMELKEQLLRQTIFDLQNSIDSLKIMATVTKK